MVVLVTMAWLERPATACQDLLGDTVRLILMNVCLVRAIMEVDVWTRIIVSIVCVLQEQGEAFANKVNNLTQCCNHVMDYYSPIYLCDLLSFLIQVPHWGSQGGLPMSKTCTALF